MTQTLLYISVRENGKEQAEKLVIYAYRICLTLKGLRVE